MKRQDTTHEAQFYQLEGLMVGPRCFTLANHKAVLEGVFRADLFGDQKIKKTLLVKLFSFRGAGRGDDALLF